MTQEQLFERRMELTKDQVRYFLENELFTWQWWFLVAMTIIPWLLWFILRDKKIQGRLLLGGAIVGLVSLVGDMIGTQAGLWRYAIKAIPSLPPLIPYDLAIMPIEYMAIQQIAKSNKQLIWLALAVAAANAFLAEPFLKMINVYIPIGWQKIYSFPIYFLIFMFTSLFVNKLGGFSTFYNKARIQQQK